MRAGGFLGAGRAKCQSLGPIPPPQQGSSQGRPACHSISGAGTDGPGLGWAGWGSGSMGQAAVCGMESLHLGLPVSHLNDFPDLL